MGAYTEELVARMVATFLEPYTADDLREAIRRNFNLVEATVEELRSVGLPAGVLRTLKRLSPYRQRLLGEEFAEAVARRLKAKRPDLARVIEETAPQSHEWLRLQFESARKIAMT